MLQKQTKDNRGYPSNYSQYYGESHFIFNEASGLYEPYAYSAKRTSENHGSKDRPFFVRTSRDYLALVVSVLTLLLLGGTVYYANQQWQQMVAAANGTIRSARAAWANAETASDALSDNRDSFRETLQQMEIQGWYQGESALASMRASNAARMQVEAMRDLVDETRKSADSAREALHISERAYVTLGSGNLNAPQKEIDIPIANSGRIPSGKVQVVMHEITVNVDKPTALPMDIKDAVERHCSIHSIDSISNVSPMAITIPIPQADGTRLNSGKQMIEVAGYAVYNDGFPKTPNQSTSFCVNTVYHEVIKKLFIVPCDPTDQIPKLGRFDGFPDGCSRQ